MGLGECKTCHGALCLSRGTVACSRCGQPHPEHPEAVKIARWRQQELQHPPAAPEVPPQDYPATLIDRVNALERLTRRLERQLGELRREVRELREQPTTGGVAAA